MSEPPDEPSVTPRYGDYEVESFLGKGSIGKVYLAKHRRIGRRVALKTVHLKQKFEDEIDKNEFYRRLQREAELCALMQHPNVVTLYDVGYEEDRVSYLATEYIDGESLLARLRRTRPLPVQEALAIGFDLLRGLAYAHSKGIIHRDIKPANILLTAEGQAKIADFGVARPLNSSLTATRSLVGTPNYMSPEQVKTTPVSTRSDLFSAGVVIYEMLTGVKPFSAPELSGILYNVVNLTPQLASDVNPSVPRAVAGVLAKLMSKKPDERYSNATEALEDLDRATRGAAPEPEPPPADSVTISVRGDDMTTPLPTVIDEEPGGMRRPVRASIFWGVSIVLAGALAAAVYVLEERADREQPTAVFTRAQLEEPVAKRNALDAARALVDQGRYEDAIRDYDAYLAKYPHSAVAQTERAEAQKLWEEAKPKTEITRVARKPKKELKPEEPPPKPPSRWQRFKKWIKGS